MTGKMLFRCLAMLVVSLVCTGWTAVASRADSVRDINKDVDVTLDRFRVEVSEGKKILESAKGVLVFPNVLKGGMVIGGEYGEGALLIGEKTVDYYSTAAASIGFQLGVQKKSVIILFMQDEALKRFRASSGWKVGVDASIAVITVGAGGAMDTAKLNEPIVAFILGQKGLMYNLTLEGAKFTKLSK